MLVFDKETTRVLDNAYRGREITARRLANLDALAPTPGDEVLDLGCGNGLMTSELSRAVGPKGHVTGLDPSADMRASAARHCAGQTNITFAEGMADDMPFNDQSFDGAISVQVFEYISDIPAALAEVHRVLKPGGRLVIGDMHWDTLAWYSRDRERMQRVLGIWDGHLAHREIPAQLPQMMRDVGFAFDGVQQVPFWDTQLKPDGIPMMLLNLIEAYAVQTGVLTKEEAHGWVQEQHGLAAQERFFFSISHFVCVAQKS